MLPRVFENELCNIWIAGVHILIDFLAVTGNANTDGRHFESPAEIAMLNGHADIVGQSICPEVYLAREIGACYAGLYYETVSEKYDRQI